MIPPGRIRVTAAVVALVAGATLLAGRVRVSMLR